MKLTADQVHKVATLANLPLSEDEQEKYSDQLSAILDYIDQLDRVRTSDISPTYNTTGLENVLDEDKTRPSLSSEQALSNGVNVVDNLFVTKGVFDE